MKAHEPPVASEGLVGKLAVRVWTKTSTPDAGGRSARYCRDRGRRSRMTEGSNGRAHAQEQLVFLPKHDADAAWNELQRLLPQVTEPDETPTEGSMDATSVPDSQRS
jgi:hypothetical protein